MAPPQITLQNHNTTGFYVSAAHKSSGKTIIALGLRAAFGDRGLKVQPFKKGPDYIDPLWLARAAHTDCINLDFNTQNRSQIISSFLSCSAEAAPLLAVRV